MMTTFGCFIVLLATCCTEGKKSGSGILDHVEVGDDVFGEAVEEITAIVELRSYEGQENTSYASVVAAEGSQIVLSCGVADDSDSVRTAWWHRDVTEIVRVRQHQSEFCLTIVKKPKYWGAVGVFIDHSNFSLLIPNFGEKDKGKYSCRFKTSSSEITHKLEFQVNISAAEAGEAGTAQTSSRAAGCPLAPAQACPPPPPPPPRTPPKTGKCIYFIPFVCTAALAVAGLFLSALLAYKYFHAQKSLRAQVKESARQVP